MFRPLKTPIVGLFAFAAFILAASAQIGGVGWTRQTLNFKIQSPTNAPQNQRYWFTNNIYHCLTYSNDGAFSVGNTTLPRTEQRFNSDYTSGEIQYQSTIMAPGNENSYAVFQIHTGDAQSDAFGSTTFMAFWFTNNGGSIHDYSGTTLATNLANKWFQLNVDHNLVTHTIRVWIDKKLVWTQQDNGATDFYMKDGVYEQSHGPTLQMDTSLTNIIMWTSPGNGPPAGPIGLTATATNGQVNLTWNDSVAAVNYNVKRSTNSVGPFTNIVANTTATNYTDGNVAVGPTYWYVVSAIDSFGESTNSSKASVTLPDPGYQLTVAPASQTVAAGDSANYSVTMTTNANFTGTVTFLVTGMPTGATANFSPATLNAPGNTTLSVQTAANTFSGTYPLIITGTNGPFVVTTNTTLTVNGVAAIPGTMLWTAASGTDTNWSTIFNWTNATAGAYGPPGANNTVVFTNAGAALTPGVPNNFLDSSLAILSLQYTHTNKFHTTQIAPGSTLTVGTNLSVGTGTDLGVNGSVYTSIKGAGATLLMNNSAALVNVRQGTETSAGPWLQRATLDLSGLDTLSLNARRILVAADGVNSREIGTLFLARTNIITVTGSAPAIDVGENPSNGAGGSADPSVLNSFVYLGQTNAIFADSIGIGRSKASGTLIFNPALLNNNPTLYLRGATSSRVTTFSVGDESPLSFSNQRGAGKVDLTGGTVDAMIGTAYIGRSMSGTNYGTAPSATGTLTFDSGTIDINTLEVGYQTSAIDKGPGAVGTVNVNGTALLLVNQLLELTHGNLSVPAEQGTLNINGGVVRAKNISGGGGLATINLTNGTLDLQSGALANVSTLNIGVASATDPALLANATSITVSNPVVIAANGTLAGNTLITTPGLTVNGALSPGTNGPGWMTNNGPVTFGAGGNYTFKIQDAASGPAMGWSFLKSSAAINILASSGNPFVVQLQSTGLTANFNFHTNYDWPIATANGGIANFDPGKMAVDDSLFANDLAGGYFRLGLNNNSLVLSFTNNHPPAANLVAVNRSGTVMTIPIATLASQWSDPDGDPVTLVTVNTSSAIGINNVGTDGAYIYYTNANNVVDSITYTVQDVRTNPPAVYQPGDTIQTAVGTVMILPPHPLITSPAIQSGNLVLSGNGGFPGGPYYVLSSTNLLLPPSQWTPIGTDVFDNNGAFNFTNTPDPAAQQLYYLLQTP